MRVTFDEPEQTDALCVHGPPLEGEKIVSALASVAAERFRKNLSPIVVFMGMGADEAKKHHITWIGAKRWIEIFTGCGVPREAIQLTPPARHTAEEAMGFLSCAAQKNWRKITILSTPHHILRCFLQILGLRARAPNVDVYSCTLPFFYWRETYRKTLLGGGCSVGTLHESIVEEYNRIEKYAQKPGVGYTPHATIPELISYLQERDDRSRT